ncbi:fibronectin type III domain-containing protein [Anaerofustis stercorihominis]|uniref:Fibronectin type-III domain-containing protein n=1 Tax=Anaerofustis stercorihominis TaxID=214853 RepID=A0A3E3DY60_9FIRM|nr:hypothetical protein [Anaerofustis stercorihominis]RGD74190.1 hypothetical protein DW687_05335 [Anaerofustis stercorihominis]
MKNSKKILCGLVAFLFMFSCVSAVSAATPKKFLNVKSPREVVTNKYVKISSPTHKKVYYKGEKINVTATVKDPFGNGYTGVVSFLMGSKGQTLAEGSTKLFKGTYTYKTTLNTKKAPNGANYVVVGIADATDETGSSMELALTEIKVATLKAPTKVKAKAGKRKVTLSFKKATGGKKYEIYRSTKKTKGYKKVKTTTSNKFTNKKLKKGKRYYYKVRTVRGSVKSSFTKPIRTPKVK